MLSRVSVTKRRVWIAESAYWMKKAVFWMWRRVDIVLIEVSEKRIASIFRVEKKKKSESEPA
jgi:hypothetical protein